MKFEVVLVTEQQDSTGALFYEEESIGELLISWDGQNTIITSSSLKLIKMEEL